MVAVGDKIRVTRTPYPIHVPNGERVVISLANGWVRVYGIPGCANPGTGYPGWPLGPDEFEEIV